MGENFVLFIRSILFADWRCDAKIDTQKGPKIWSNISLPGKA